MKCSINQLFDPNRLPLYKPGVKVHYEGSIDKTGGNSDWDWWLYQDSRGEWVLFEQYGPGCIFNFVQHRYPESPEATFRFYFDGEEEPRFVIKNSQFGEVYPFIKPTADYYYNKIRVIRSFVPMPFKTRCKITSDVKLCGSGNGGGGWGHVIYHTYADSSVCDIDTFDRGSREYADLKNLLKRAGGDIKELKNEKAVKKFQFVVNAGESAEIFKAGFKASVSSIKIKTSGYDRGNLKNLWIRTVWDGRGEPDVYCPIGAFFANEYGAHGMRYLFCGMDAEGGYYCFFPMPFDKSASIEIVNRGSAAVSFDMSSVGYTEELNTLYASGSFGYFRTSKYYERRATKGADSIICDIEGQHGHIVGAVVSAWDKPGVEPFDNAACEGDVRVHIDGIRTPQIESDGSESHSCYGWGFCTPPENNPLSGYDGGGVYHKPWSMTRLCPGDWYPFNGSLRFGIESGCCNDIYLEHSGTVFYYGGDGSLLTKTAEIVIGDNESEKANGYLSLDGDSRAELDAYFEGDDDDKPVHSRGIYSKSGSEFDANVAENTEEVIIRRVSDQLHGRQAAKVYVDGAEVTERIWYFADRNPHKRWLEDEFVIGRKYFQDKNKIRIKIEPVKLDGAVNWNEFGYTVFCRRFESCSL